MSYKIKFLDDAKVDLYCIEEYLSQFYPSTARNFFEQLKEKFLLLEDMPYMYQAYELDLFLRRMVFDDYIFFYNVDDKRNFVIIHRIFHSKRDINTEMQKYKTGEMEVNEAVIAYHTGKTRRKMT